MTSKERPHTTCSEAQVSCHPIDTTVGDDDGILLLVMCVFPSTAPVISLLSLRTWLLKNNACLAGVLHLSPWCDLLEL
jgi:hypothetical protein